MNPKSIDILKKVAIIKFEGEFLSKAEIPTLKVKAIYALSGGYNQMARKVDLARYEQIKKRYDQAVSDMAYELKKAGN
jgi:protein involved in polysaccharide export with SLBB domain